MSTQQQRISQSSSSISLHIIPDSLNSDDDVAAADTTTMTPVQTSSVSASVTLSLSATYGWPVVSALLLALFVVILKRCVETEEKLNIPMFYGEAGYPQFCCGRRFAIVVSRCAGLKPYYPQCFLMHTSRGECLAIVASSIGPLSLRKSRAG